MSTENKLNRSLALLIVAAALGAAGCANTTSAAPPPPSPTVEVAEVVQQNVPIHNEW